jgi:hypothetical protein
MMKPNLKIADEPPRSAEREALAEAIARRDAATTRLARLKAALDANPLYGDDGAIRAHEKAEAALTEARAGEGSYLAAVAIGEASGDSNPVLGVERALAEAQSRLDVVRKTHRALEDQVESTETEIKSAKDDRDKCVRAVLRDEASGVIETMLQQAAALQEQLSAKRALLSFLRSEAFEWRDRELAKPIDDFLAAPAHPREFDGTMGSHPACEPWKAAVAALAADPDAPLPI